METLRNRLRNHPLGIYFQVWAALALIVFGVFSYLSITACGETASSPGCGSPSGSNQTHEDEVPTTSGQATIYQGIAPPTVFSTASAIPGAQVQRLIGWTDNQPAQLVWNPPPGSTNFVFTDPAKQPQPGGPPFVFLTPPDSIPVQFNMPTLSPGKSSMKVTETVEYADASGSSFTSLVTPLQNTSVKALEASPRSPVSAPVVPRTLGAPILALRLERWIDYNGVTLDTARCQQVTDWLQSKATFVALRVPVSAVASGNPFVLPLLFPANADQQPQVRLHGYQPPPFKPDIIDPLPLELRPERMTFAENELPPAVGEQGQWQWVTLGASQTPKAVCPGALNYTSWRYQISVPADLAGKGTGILLYFCQEGQDPPPFTQAALQAAGQVPKGRKTLGVQAGGITCIGPQTHSLLTSSTIQLGNPAIAWNIQPPKEVKIRNEVLINGSLPINLNFHIDSQVAGVNWKLYEGDQIGPDTSKPITSPFTISNSAASIWVVGTISQGTASGPYNLTLTAAKDGDPTISDSITDILWVGDWVPPPTALTGNFLFLPLLQKQ